MPCKTDHNLQLAHFPLDSAESAYLGVSCCHLIAPFYSIPNRTNVQSLEPNQTIIIRMRFRRNSTNSSRLPVRTTKCSSPAATSTNCSPKLPSPSCIVRPKSTSSNGFRLTSRSLPRFQKRSRNCGVTLASNSLRPL